jgi:hypothetical protein
MRTTTNSLHLRTKSSSGLESLFHRHKPPPHTTIIKSIFNRFIDR